MRSGRMRIVWAAATLGLGAVAAGLFYSRSAGNGPSVAADTAPPPAWQAPASPTLSLAAAPAAAPAAVVAPAAPRAARQSLAPLVGLLDGVGVYRKSGLVELYGLALRQRRGRPIAVSTSELHITHDDAWLIWTPRRSAVRGATHVQVVLDGRPAGGELCVGVVSATGTIQRFVHRFGPDGPSPAPAPLPTLVPPAFVAQAKAAPATALADCGEVLQAELPAAFSQSLAERGLQQLFIGVRGQPGRMLALKQVALARAGEGGQAGVALRGRVRGEALAPGAQVELIREDNVRRTATLSLDGAFIVDDVPAAMPVCVRLLHRGRHWHSTLGRWFVPTVARDDVDIDLVPEYINADGHAADPSKQTFVGPRAPQLGGSFLEQHSIRRWPGAGPVQEYDATVFTNNYGFLDADRFFDNPDGMLRLVDVGSSCAVALQIPVCEKYSTLLEEEAGLLLQRPVEVVSAGTDNGDIGANYPKIRDYAARFNPAMVLVETCSMLVMQLSPTMLRDGWGWQHDHSAIPNFYRDVGGALRFRMGADDYGLFATKPTSPEYTKGIPFYSTLMVPEAELHPTGREALGYLTDIARYIRGQHPQLRLVLHTGWNQSTAGGKGLTPTTLADGRSIEVGVDHYVRHIARASREAGIEVISPPVPPAPAGNEEGYTFRYDMHYSRRGHQWLALELAKGVAALVGNRVADARR